MTKRESFFHSNIMGSKVYSNIHNQIKTLITIPDLISETGYLNAQLSF